jgi:hypothetical protein
VLDHMAEKRKRRLGKCSEDRPTKKIRKRKSENLSICGCGLTDQTKSRHTRNARHQAWLSGLPDTNPLAVLVYIPQAGDQAKSHEWGTCILASETIAGWNVLYPGYATEFFASSQELGL